MNSDNHLVLSLSYELTSFFVTELTFPPPFSASGVAANAKVGSELIKVLAIDNDIGNNSVVLYHIITIHYFQSQSNGSEDVGSVFTIGEFPETQ